MVSVSQLRHYRLCFSNYQRRERESDSQLKGRERERENLAHAAAAYWFFQFPYFSLLRPYSLLFFFFFFQIYIYICIRLIGLARGPHWSTQIEVQNRPAGHFIIHAARGPSFVALRGDSCGPRANFFFFFKWRCIFPDFFGRRYCVTASRGAASMSWTGYRQYSINIPITGDLYDFFLHLKSQEFHFCLIIFPLFFFVYDETWGLGCTVKRKHCICIRFIPDVLLKWNA